MATQTRITEDAHRRLVRLAKQTGKSRVDVIDMALSLLERDLFLDNVNAGYAAMRRDPAKWSAELAERDVWDAAISDDGEVANTRSTNTRSTNPRPKNPRPKKAGA